MKKYLLTFVLMGITSLSWAQDANIEPGQQAKGYLDSKRVSVDHATGIFYYSVPLHEIRVGDFTLPVTLDYAARGVKADDKPGAVGYNWNLNTGGVVTRTIRGGIADEVPYKGMAHIDWTHLDNNLAGYVRGVNLREVDGESDMFTAVFNGRSVNFVIRYRKNIDPHLIAIPLEPTNVKIECIFTDPGDIAGWIITDEEGNKYTYLEKELSSNTREGTVETNSIV